MAGCSETNKYNTVGRKARVRMWQRVREQVQQKLSKSGDDRLERDMSHPHSNNTQTCGIMQITKVTLFIILQCTRLRTKLYQIRQKSIYCVYIHILYICVCKI